MIRRHLIDAARYQTPPALPDFKLKIIASTPHRGETAGDNGASSSRGGQGLRGSGARADERLQVVLIGKIVTSQHATLF